MSLESKNLACTAYEGLLEVALHGELGSVEARRVSDHITKCAGCRAAWDAAEESARLLRMSALLMDRPADPGPGFARVVMARIRMEAERVAGEKSFWIPLVSFAWRFALTATLALGLLVTYGTVWRDHEAANTAAMSASDAEPQRLFTDTANQPANQDDVLVMVAETNHGSH